MYVFSIILIVASNVLYNICQKSTPANANPFLSLFFTYLTAAGLTIIAILFTSSGKNLWPAVRELNWTSAVLGISIVGLEFGYLMAYRSGWNISIGSLVANILLAIALIPVGILVYKEGFAVGKILGVVLCLAGLVLINRS